LGERLNGIQEVGGSTPPGSTKFLEVLIRRSTNKYVILRSSALSAERLEGWQQTPNLLPSFETAARKRERPLRMTTQIVSLFA
jgi:hypothetical protein